MTLHRIPQPPLVDREEERHRPMAGCIFALALALFLLACAGVGAGAALIRAALA